MIHNFNKAQIGPCSYTFSLGSIFKHQEDGKEVKEQQLPFTLPANGYVLAKTTERITIPKDLSAQFLPKSTAWRMGLHILCGLGDPGYEGEVVFGIKNISNKSIELTSGMQLLQMTLQKVQGEIIPLQTAYLGGKVL